MSTPEEVTTNELLQEIADLSARISQLRPGVSATIWCPKCWRPPSQHKGGSIKGCKSKTKMPVDQFTRELLQQRNNLVRCIRSADTEGKQSEAIDALQNTVERQAQTIESNQERIRSLQATKQVMLHLMRNLNDAYLAFITGGNENEMKRIFKDVDDLLVSLNTESKSSSENEDDDDGDGEDDDDGWDHTGDRTTWPIDNASIVADGNRLFPADNNDAGATEAGAIGGVGATKKVHFSFSPVLTHSSNSSKQGAEASGQTTRTSGQTTGTSGQTTGTSGQTGVASGQRIVNGILRPASSNRSVYDVQANTHTISTPSPNPPSTPQYPGLFEKPGVVLIFPRGGTLCGGEADADSVVRAAKIVNVDFKENMDALLYLEQRRKLVDQLSCYFGACPMFTHLGIFALKAHVFYKTFQPIFKREATFSSFMAFVKEFEHQLYPNLDSIALGRLHNRKQQSNESVSEYFTDYVDLIFIIGRQEDDYIQPFLAGLYNRTLAHTVSNAQYEDGQRTLRRLANHAQHIEAQISLDKAFLEGKDNKNNHQRNVSALTNTGSQQSSSASHRGRGHNTQTRGAPAPRGGSAPAGRGWTSGAAGRGWTSGAGRGWSNSGAGRGWSNGNGGGGNWSKYAPPRSQSLPRGSYAGSGARGGANTMLSQESWKSAWDTSSNEPSQSQWQEAPQSTWSAQVNELTTEGDYPDVVPNNEASISSASASSLTPVGLLVEGKMRSLGLRGCGSCLSPHHRFDGLYDKCRELCPCCGIHLQNNDHLAVDCREGPRDKSEAIYLAKEAFLNGNADKTYISA